ncbi:arsenic resistance protein [Desulfuribacillus alkaliarsenatis]|uniref:arsenic resistance protein n=1 Tax=Desulfuribacillus alkaliarsenatis TaxID=766136 RepID=UPI00159EF691|nr:bile acid:sodium symporter [Desulfuribacillus alkaliarsenatis]
MSTFWKIFMIPNRNIVYTVPLTILSGLIVGLLFDTSGLRDYVLIVSILMVYPLMIGLKISEIFNLKYIKLINTSLLINFISIPLIAYLLGFMFLRNQPELFAGLAIIALLPTGTMTVAFTLIAKGNVPASLQLTVVGLVIGAILAPWYLLVMVGQFIPIDLMQVFQTIFMVIFIPLIAGLITYYALLTKIPETTFKEKIKPKLPGFTAYGMIYIIFTSISINANRIVSDWHLLLLAVFVLFLFYIAIFSLSYFIGKRFYTRENCISLVYGTALRNLAIGLGLAVTTFGADAALMVALCFLFQQQFAVQFGRIINKSN